MVKEVSLNIRVPKKLKDEVVIAAKLQGLNKTQYITKAIVHELNGRTDYNTATYELNALKEYVDSRLEEINVSHDVSQNATQEGNVSQSVSQNVDELPDKMVDVSKMPIEKMTTLAWVTRFVEDRIFHTPTIPPEVIEKLANNVYLTSTELIAELKNAGLEFTIM